ncbi:hypothetical protein B0H19DRAFT_1064207 [Mycena capillaripes]|nr:hypothetical protein B0H19DRAFT_1064207 [Mycena capillaripes]
MSELFEVDVRSFSSACLLVSRFTAPPKLGQKLGGRGRLIEKIHYHRGIREVSNLKEVGGQIVLQTDRLFALDRETAPPPTGVVNERMPSDTNPENLEINAGSTDFEGGLNQRYILPIQFQHYSRYYLRIEHLTPDLWALGNRRASCEPFEPSGGHFGYFFVPR